MISLLASPLGACVSASGDVDWDNLNYIQVACAGAAADSAGCTYDKEDSLAALGRGKK